MKMRHQFTLPEGDEAYLVARGLVWETIVENGARWLLIHNFPAPGGYNYAKVMAAVKIETGCPDPQLGMVYSRPALARLGGRPIGALSSPVLGGGTWHPWPPRRTPQRPSRPGGGPVRPCLALGELSCGCG